MSFENPYQTYGGSQLAARAADWERADFIRKTYLHLAGAVGAFIGLEMLAFTLIGPQLRMDVLRRMMGTPFSWLLVMVGYMVVSYIAEKWANSTTSLSTQYAGLGLYVAAEAVIFLPLLFIAEQMPGVIPAAAIITGVVFAGLTGVVFMTRAELSSWGRYLSIAGFAALGFIIFSCFFPQMATGMGPIFCVLMVVLASGYIMYQTSAVMHRYQTTQYVAASLALFASLALLFWYVLRIVMELSGRD